jgi:hyaluronate lyase
MTHENPNSDLEIAVSDPTQINSTINITLNRAAAAVISNDPAITVTQLSPTIKLSVNVSGVGGQTFKAHLQLVNNLASDNFDSYAAGSTLGSNQGWYISNSDSNESVTVAGVPSSTDLSMMLNDSSTTYSASAWKSIAAQYNTVTAQFDFMEASAGKYSSFSLTSGNTNGTNGPLLRTTGSGLAWVDSSNNYHTIQTESSNTWYTVQLVVHNINNVQMQNYDIYVNGVLKVTGATFNSPVTSLNGIRFTTGGSPTGTTYINNVSVN